MPPKIPAKRLLPGLLILVIVLASLFLFFLQEQSLDSLLSEIYELPTTTTIQELERDGYLDLTDVLPGPIDGLNTFLLGGSASRPTILKTVTDSPDGPVIRILHRPEDSQTVYMTTYYVAGQGVENLNCPFSTQTTETVSGGGVTEVWLVQTENMAVNAPNYPVSDPFLFYSYRTS